MPTLTWGFLMLKFLRSKLKLKKPTHKNSSELTHKTHQSPIRNQPKNSKTKKDRPKRRSLKHLHAVLKQDPLFFLSIPVARRPQGIEKKVLLVRNCCKEQCIRISTYWNRGSSTCADRNRLSTTRSSSRSSLGKNRRSICRASLLHWIKGSAIGRPAPARTRNRRF